MFIPQPPSPTTPSVSMMFLIVEILGLQIAVDILMVASRELRHLAGTCHVGVGRAQRTVTVLLVDEWAG